MQQDQPRVNPFYVLLVLAGAAFCITACAYGVMVFLDSQPPAAGRDMSDHPLLEFLANYGAMLLTVELVLLAIGTFGAIGTDRYWSRQDKSPK